MNTDVTDQRGMLSVAPEVVLRIAVFDGPFVSSVKWAFIKLLEITGRHKIIKVAWVASLRKNVHIQFSLVSS